MHEGFLIGHQKRPIFNEGHHFREVDFYFYNEKAWCFESETKTVSKSCSAAAAGGWVAAAATVDWVWFSDVGSVT